MRIRLHQERGLILVMCGTILVVSMYLEQEVRTDEGEGQQLAAGTGVVARPGFVARAGDRRLFTGAASLVRIFLLPPTLSGANRVNFREPRTAEVRRTPLLRGWVNSVGCRAHGLRASFRHR